MRLTHLIGSLAFGSALLASSVAGAQERGNRLPLNYIDRPLTLPAGVLEPQVEFQAVHTPTPLDTSFTAYNLNVGAAVGLAPNFELQSTFLPMELGPNQLYGNPNVQGTFRLARGRFDLGARLNVQLNTVPVATFSNQNGHLIKETSIKVDSTTVSPGFPLILRFNHQARIDTGIFADFTVGREVRSTDAAGNTVKTDGTIVGLRLPVDLSVALAKNAYIGGGTGFQIDDLNQSGNSFSMPLKLFAGWSWGTRRHPFFDLEPYVSWDHLFTPGQSSPNAATTGATTPPQNIDTVAPTTPTTAGPQSTFHWNAWTFGLQFRGYLHFI